MPPRETPTRTILLDAQGALPHLDRLFRFGLMLTGNQADAEDLVQDVVERLLRRPRPIAAQSELGYLATMLRNRHLDLHRQRHRRPATVPLEDDFDVAPGRAGELPEQRLEQREVLAAIAALAGGQRDVLVAVDIVGLSYKEAAATLGIPVGTVMSRLFRARASVVQQCEAGVATPC